MIIFQTKRSLTLVELILVLCLIFIMIGFFGYYANFTVKAGRQTALQSELMNIRLAIKHYEIINNKPPDNLSSLFKDNLTKDKPDDKLAINIYLQPFRLDKEGYLLDPFFNRYGYNKISGIVYSQTRNYERW